MGYAIFQMMRFEMTLELEAYLTRAHANKWRDITPQFFGRV